MTPRDYELVNKWFPEDTHYVFHLGSRSLKAATEVFIARKDDMQNGWYVVLLPGKYSMARAEGPKTRFHSASDVLSAVATDIDTVRLPL